MDHDEEVHRTLRNCQSDLSYIPLKIYAKSTIFETMSKLVNNINSCLDVYMYVN